jgi:hypothetical protein
VDDDDFLTNQTTCKLHGQMEPCLTCWKVTKPAQSFMSIDPDKDKHMFKYEVYRFKGVDTPRGSIWNEDGLPLLTEYLNDMGKRGEEVVSVQIVDHFDALVVTKVHHST